MIRHSLIIAFICTAGILKADDNIPANYAGLKASNISGYGLYYARNISENFRLKGIGFSYYFQSDKNEESKSIFNYDIGLEIQRYIYRSKSSKVFVLAGAYYYSDTDTDKNPLTEKKSVTDSFNAGFGMGTEFNRGRVTFGLDIGYKYYKDDIDIYTDGKITGYEKKKVTKLAGGISFGFSF